MFDEYIEPFSEEQNSKLKQIAIYSVIICVFCFFAFIHINGKNEYLKLLKYYNDSQKLITSYNSLDNKEESLQMLSSKVINAYNEQLIKCKRINLIFKNFGMPDSIKSFDTFTDGNVGFYIYPNNKVEEYFSK